MVDGRVKAGVATGSPTIPAGDSSKPAKTPARTSSIEPHPVAVCGLLERPPLPEGQLGGAVGDVLQCRILEESRRVGRIDAEDPDVLGLDLEERPPCPAPNLPSDPSPTPDPTRAMGVGIA